MSEATEFRTALFYGTLMSPEVLYRVIYGTVSPDPWQKDRLSIQPGLLYGYQRRRVRYADYPAIYPIQDPGHDATPESQRVLGTVVKGLSDVDIARLDIFEGDQYDRKNVQAFLLDHIDDATNHDQSASNTIQAETYVWKEDYLSDLETQEWDFEEFRREKLQYWAGPEVMREDYEIVDAAVANGEIDGTGGRGASGSITKQLNELKDEKKADRTLQSAV